MSVCMKITRIFDLYRREDWSVLRGVVVKREKEKGERMHQPQNKKVKKG
jgi:hypothetical protein